MSLSSATPPSLEKNTPLIFLDHLVRGALRQSIRQSGFRLSASNQQLKDLPTSFGPIMLASHSQFPRQAGVETIAGVRGTRVFGSILQMEL